MLYEIVDYFTCQIVDMILIPFLRLYKIDDISSYA
jgi:hypothetical protein